MDQDDETTGVEADPAFRNDLRDVLLATDDVERFLQEVAEMAAAVMGRGISAGVTLSRNGGPVSVALSDAESRRYDDVQYTLGEGPCLTSLRTGEPVHIEDLSTDEHFPRYREAALPLGVRAVFSLPLDGGNHAVGALNLYSRHPGAFGDREQAEARRFAREASRALSLAIRLIEQIEQNDQLRTALASRAVIDQAIGVIMGQNRCSAEEAFDVLRESSQHRNVKLRVVAEWIVTSAASSRETLRGRRAGAGHARYTG